MAVRPPGGHWFACDEPLDASGLRFCLLPGQNETASQVFRLLAQFFLETLSVWVVINVITCTVNGRKVRRKEALAHSAWGQTDEETVYIETISSVSLQPSCMLVFRKWMTLRTHTPPKFGG